MRAIYQEARPTYQAMLRGHYRRTGGFAWLDLYKLNPAVLQEQQDYIRSLTTLLVLEDIAVLDQSDLALSSESQRIDSALPDMIVRFGLDSSDAMILLEAARAGIPGVVSFDRDMRRAVSDFDIYTWLNDD